MSFIFQSINPQDDPDVGRIKINSNFNLITNISGGTGSSVFIQNGTNTFTGGTASLPTVNITSASLLNLSTSGTSTSYKFSATTLSGGTILSGSSNLYSIFLTTGGTNTLLQLSATTISATTIYSGSTDLTSIFIPYQNLNYAAVNANGNAFNNGNQLLNYVPLAQSLTPNNSVLTTDNRSVVYLFAGTYDLGNNFISLGEFVDIIGVGDPKNIIITSSNSTGTIQIANNNDYILKNITINNTDGGGSIVHNVGQTDNGTWENLILGAKTTLDTIFNGEYSGLFCTSNDILNGNISGTVKGSKFLNNSCGFSTTINTVSGTIEDCTGSDNCFGVALNDACTISGTLRRLKGNDNCFGYSNAWYVAISGALIEDCEGNDSCFGSANTVALIDTNSVIKRCKGNNYCFGVAITRTDITTTTFEDCKGNDHCFGVALSHDTYGTTIASTSIFKNCIGNDYCFGYTIGGPIVTAGSMEDCEAENDSFGDTTATGKLIRCKRTNGYGTHTGTIERCTFSENHATTPTLTLASGAIVKYSTIYQGGAGECFDAVSGTTISVYQSTSNKTIESGGNITNNITTPNNVIDSNIII